MGKHVLVRKAKFYGHIEKNYQERHQIPLSLTCLLLISRHFHMLNIEYLQNNSYHSDLASVLVSFLFHIRPEYINPYNLFFYRGKDQIVPNLLSHYRSVYEETVSTIHILDSS